MRSLESQCQPSFVAVANEYLPKCMLGIAASELTTSPLIQILSALSCRTVSRKPYSFGNRRGGMVGKKVNVMKAKRFVKVSVRRAMAKML